MFPLPVGDFGAFNLVDAVDEVAFSGAIDALNTDISLPGRARSRDGYAKFTSVAGTNRYDSLGPVGLLDGSRQLLAGAGTRVDALNSSGAVLTSVTGLAQGPYSICQVATPGSTYAYLANGSDTLRRWDTLTFSAPTATVNGVAGRTMPAGTYLAVQAPDNRLVCACFTADIRSPGGLGQGTASHVYFSDAGAPETWTTTNSIQLGPGDGESITGMVVWRELLFVFKPSRFWVFYGNNTDPSGNPIFNVRPVTNSVGLVAPRAVVAARDGVYFLDRKGVYRTTGGVAQRVSGPLDPLFFGPAHPYSQVSQVNQAQIGVSAMGAFREQVYVAVPTGASTTNNRMLVLGAAGWMPWDIPASALATFRAGTTEELFFTYAAGTNDIGRHSSAYTQDGGDGLTTGAGITCRYQSGFDNLAPPRRFAAHYLFGNTRKRIRKWKVTGTGTVAFNVAHDFAAMPAASSQNVTLGVSPAVDDGWYQVAKRGQKFSYRIADVSGAPWSVQSLTSYLAGSEPPLLGNPSDT